MESRMEKYYNDNNSNMQRSTKNAKLYREISQNYNDLENLPIPDNTNEINMSDLKRMVQKEKDKNVDTREIRHYTDIVKKDDDVKIHDINKLLENARKENEKLKDNTFNSYNEHASNYDLLKTSDVEFDNNTQINDDELKYETKKISDNPVIEQIISEDNTADLSLDILSDLKPNGNTGVTEPVKDPMFENFFENEVENKEDAVDNKDIDILKNDVVEEDINSEDDKDNTFYTDIYKFTNKDFIDDDEEDDESDKSYVFKIILLIIFIIGCGALICYFLTKYGFD